MEGFLQLVAGPRLSASQWVRRLQRIRADFRVAGVAALLSSLILIPYLGAVGLWDPWETHYGEVAREMIERNDYVYPYWETAWFFSKPPLTMWIQALGMQLVGAQSGDGALSIYTEWGMRLPFALYAVFSVTLLALAVTRLAGARVGLATALVLSTTPMFFLLSRQTVTDTPFVTSLICAMACALIAQLDPSTQHRSHWWYAFYFFSGLGVLAKGLLGLLPGAVLLLYALACFIPYDEGSWKAHWAWLTDRSVRAAVDRGERPMPALWGQLYRMRLLTGIGTFFAVAAPWYVTMMLFKGVDDEGKTWFQRFIVHDHFNRLAAGVHTTTPGGSFSYFIEQAGYAFFPWVAILPGALVVAARARPRDPSPTEQLIAISTLWAGLSFFLIGMSATKFHHYLFPVVPAVAVLMAVFIDRLWKEGIAAQAGALLFGFVLLAMVAKDLSEAPVANASGALYGGFKNFTDLFVYNYDRPYPAELLNRPLQWFTKRPLYAGEVTAVALLAIGGYFLLEAFFGERRSATGRSSGIGVLFLGAAFLMSVSSRQAGLFWPLVGAALLTVAWCAIEAVRSRPSLEGGVLVVAAIAGAAVIGVLPVALSADRLVLESRVATFLFQPLTLRVALGMLFVVFIGIATLGGLLRSRLLVFGSFTAGTLAFALWFNWSHWVSLSHHWTQRDLFWRYYEKRRPAEPIAAFLMNWKGETFYSRNTVRQIPIADTARKMQLFVAPPGREWALVEHQRLAALRAAVGADKVVTPVDRDLNNKFLLVSIE